MNLSYLALALGLVIGVMELGPIHPASTSPGHAGVDWPTEFEGVPLEPLALSTAESGFAAGFPGAIARFRRGDREVILRHVNRATRKLHDSATCLKAAGFRIEHDTPDHQSVSGWLNYMAHRNGQAFRVREQIRSVPRQEATWTDVSRWFWHATFHPDAGPWIALTVLEPVEAEHENADGRMD